MSFETATQMAVYAALNGNISCGVYDDAPYLPEGMPESSFPYIVIGNDTHTPFSTDDAPGASSTITLHVWSRYSGFSQVKGIMGEAYDLLNRAKISMAGYNVVDCLWEFSESMVDGDGMTRHGVQRYRITAMEA